MACAPDSRLTSFHHPNGGACLIFDEAKVLPLILAWQRTGNEDLFREIIEGCLDLIRVIILQHRFDYDELDALINDCTLKLRQALPRFRPERGRAFSFISVALRHYLIARVLRINNYRKRHLFVEQEALESCPGTARLPTSFSRNSGLCCSAWRPVSARLICGRFNSA
jgi:hypothetical protein